VANTPDHRARHPDILRTAGLRGRPRHPPVKTVEVKWADALLWVFVIAFVAGMLLAALAGRM